MNRSSVKAGASLALVLLVLLAIFMLPFWWFRLFSPFDDLTFNQAVWQQNAHSEDLENPRGRMAYDVRWRLLRARMTRAQVVALLGEPDRGSVHGTGILSYMLGAWSGFRMDYDTLEVHFGPDGRVCQVSIVQG